MRRHLFTSESVTEGHPDKLCDCASDAILDALLEQDANFRCACEVAGAPGELHIMGEITTTAYLHAGGRVSNVVYLGGQLIHLHPCIEVLEGHLVATKKYRGRLLKIVPQLIREYSQTQHLQKEQLYLLWSVGLHEDVRTAAEAEAKECGFQKITWIRTGCVITAHSGPGAFGVVGFSE